MNFQFFRLFMAALCLGWTASAAQTAIRIQDPDFESLTGTDPLHFGADGFLKSFHFSQPIGVAADPKGVPMVDPVPGWSLTGDGGVSSAVPVLSRMPEQGGRNWGYLRKGGSVRQSLGEQYQAGNLYKLVAQIAAETGRNQRFSLSFVSGNTVLARISGMVLAGSFSRIELPIAIADASSAKGFPIEIVLGNESDDLGTIYLDDVQLTKEPLPAPASASPLALGWWPADSEVDAITGTSGGFRTSGRFGPGFIKSGMVFTSDSSGFLLPDSFRIPSQEFTVEAWIQRASTQVTGVYGLGGQIFGGGMYGFSFGISDDGRLNLMHVGNWTFSSEAYVRDAGWHHVAVTRSSGILRFYVDGTLRSAVPCEQEFVLNGLYAIGSLGGGYYGSYYGFLGSIDELAVYARPLSDSQIQSIYQASVVGKADVGFRAGIADAPKSIFIPESGVFRSGVTNTGVVPLQNLRLVQALPTSAVIRSANSSGGGTVTVKDAVATLTVPSVAPGEAVVFEVSVDGEPVPSAFLTNRMSISFDQGGQAISIGPVDRVSRLVGRAILVPRGLVSWWPAEGTAEDVWGDAKGTLSGHAKFEPGMVGNGFSLEGTDSSIQLGRVPSLQLNDITIEAWIKRSSVSTASQVFPGHGVILGGGTAHYALAMLYDGRLTYSEVGITRVDSVAAVNDTEWHHIAVTRNGSDLRFFIDGVDSGSTVYGPVLRFETPLAIGALGASVPGTGVEPFYGMIDELSVYNRALTPSELFGIYRAYSNGKTTGSVDLSGFLVSSQTGVLGSAADYQFSVLNNTAGPVSGLTFDQVIPTGWTVPSLKASTGSASIGEKGIRWELGTLEAGGRATLLISAKPSEAGTASLVGTLSGWSGGVRTKSLSLTTVATPVVPTLPNLSVVAPKNAVVPAVGTNLLQFDLALDVVSGSDVFVDYGVYPIYKAGIHGSDAFFGTAVMPAGTLRSGIPVPLLAGTSTDIGTMVLMISGIRGAVGPTTTFMSVQAPYASDLRIAADNINAAIPFGGSVFSRWRLENRGTGAANAAAVSIPVPAGWRIKTLVPTQGIAELRDQGIVWNAGQVAPGSNAAIEVSFQPTQAGIGQIESTVTTPSTDVDLSNNRLTSSYRVEFLPELNAGADVAGTAPVSGRVTVPVEFRLSAPASSAVKFKVDTVDGTAVAGRDFTGIHSTVEIPAGQSSSVVPIELLAGNLVNEVLVFQVIASSVTGAVLVREALAVRVEHVVLSDLVVTGGGSDAVSTIPDPVHLSFSVVNNGPAVASAVAGVLPIPSGWSVSSVAGSVGTVQATDGALLWNVGSLEPGVTAKLNLDVAASVTGSGEFTLSVDSSTPDPIAKNNRASFTARSESPVLISLGADPSVGVPIGSPQVLPLEVRLSGASSHEVKVTYFFAQGTALAGRDFNAASGVLTFSPGTVVQTIPVTLLPNADAQSDSRFEVRLFNSAGAGLGKDSSTITLRGVATQTGIARLATGELRIRVHTIPGRSYELQRTEAIDAGTWSAVGNKYESTEEEDHDFTDPVPVDSTGLFYRVVVTSR